MSINKPELKLNATGLEFQRQKQQTNTGRRRNKYTRKGKRRLFTFWQVRRWVGTNCGHVLPVKWLDLSQSPRAISRITQVELSPTTRRCEARNGVKKGGGSRRQSPARETTGASARMCRNFRWNARVLTVGDKQSLIILILSLLLLLLPPPLSLPLSLSPSSEIYMRRRRQFI